MKSRHMQAQTPRIPTYWAHSVQLSATNLLSVRELPTTQFSTRSLGFTGLRFLLMGQYSDIVLSTACANMEEPQTFKEYANESRGGGSLAERDRADLARVGKKEVLKVRSPIQMCKILVY
jgi:hypothetical protein